MESTRLMWRVSLAYYLKCTCFIFPLKAKQSVHAIFAIIYERMNAKTGSILAPDHNSAEKRPQNEAVDQAQALIYVGYTFVGLTFVAVKMRQYAMAPCLFGIGGVSIVYGRHMQEHRQKIIQLGQYAELVKAMKDR